MIDGYGSGNVVIGYRAAYNDTVDSMLWIDNSDTKTPLIMGDFANDSLWLHAFTNIVGDAKVDSNLTVDGYGSFGDGIAVGQADTISKFVTRNDTLFCIINSDTFMMQKK
jgi:hypothetical protein